MSLRGRISVTDSKTSILYGCRLSPKRDVRAATCVAAADAGGAVVAASKREDGEERLLLEYRRVPDDFEARKDSDSPTIPVPG